MGETRECIACRAVLPLGEFRVRIRPSGTREIFGRCRECDRRWRRGQHAVRKGRDRPVDVAGHAETCRTCKVCGKEKPIEAFQTREVKYRLRTCKICQGIKERAHRRAQGRKVQRAWQNAHPRKIPKEERAERMRRYRATPIGKLTSQMADRTRWIRRSSDGAKIARWREEIVQLRAMREKVRNEMNCQERAPNLDRPGQHARF